MLVSQRLAGELLSLTLDSDKGGSGLGAEDSLLLSANSESTASPSALAKDAQRLEVLLNESPRAEAP